MFKVPDWGEDVPKNNIKFTKKVPKEKNKVKKISTPEKPKANGVVKPNFKTKPKIKSKLQNRATLKPKFKSNESLILTKEKIPLKKTHKKHEPPPSSPKQKKKVETPQVKKNVAKESIEINNYDTDKLDELILNAKKQKLKTYKSDDLEEVLFKDTSKQAKSKTKKEVKSTVSEFKTKDQRKKEVIKAILQKGSGRNNIKPSSGNKLRERMLERLKAAQFRYLNEKLYTSSGSDAQKLFQTDPAAFQTYHEGYQQQVKKWPVKPLDVIVQRIKKLPKTHTIADMGCGEAELSKRVNQSVRSFDLVATAPGVEVCDMAHTPLLSESIDVAVYCLALMGTDLTQYLIEANRILKNGGHLLIAEVESRFENVEVFSRDVQKLGFTLRKLDKSQEVFFFMEFTKTRDPPKKSKQTTLTLKPCIYKKR